MLTEVNGMLYLMLAYQEVKPDFKSPTIVDDGSFSRNASPDMAQNCNVTDSGGNYIFSGYDIVCQPLGFANKGDY
jgi:hypothetical protein